MLAVDDLAQKQDAKAGAVVSASLDVVRGAFRFTTGYEVIIGALPESADAAALADRLKGLGFAQARPTR